MGLEDSRQTFKKDENSESMESSSSINDSEESSSSSSSSTSTSTSADLTDDASSSSNACGPLYQLAELMSQLPIKRGLSKYYHGKSQTFGSLASVRSVEDLGKKETSYTYSKRMKSCKSYGGNLNHHKFGPKATIAKRSPKGPFSPSLPAKSTMLVN